VEKGLACLLAIGPDEIVAACEEVILASVK
jgi:hypothetical protein